MNVRPAIAVPAGSARFSRAEFLRMIELDAFGDISVELVAGELHRTPLAVNTHARLQMRIIAGLLKFISETMLCAKVGIRSGQRYDRGRRRGSPKVAVRG